MEKQVLYIEWEGPFTLHEIKTLNAEDDYGLYQIYGSHAVYGSNALIYIGKASAQPFGKSIYLQGWNYYDNVNGLQIYLGRLLSETPLSHTERATQIERSFKILIFAHAPAYNSEFINNFHDDKDLQTLQVINWKNYRDLLPEVSGAKWASGLGIALENFKFKKLFLADGLDISIYFPITKSH